MTNKSIFIAAKKGDLKRLKYLIKNGKNVNSRNDNGWTALHKAVYYNQEECVDYLLSLNDIEINAQTYFGNTALILACIRACTVPSTMVQKLIVAGADVNFAKWYSRSPLYYACIGPGNPNHKWYIDNLRKAEILINNNAHLNISAAYGGQTPLLVAVNNQNLDLVKMLLCKGVDVNIPRSWDNCTPLIMAAFRDNYEICKELLPKVIDVNVVTSKGRTALMLANDERIIKLLMDHGADPNISTNKKPKTALHFAASCHNLNKLKLLLPHTEVSVIISCQDHNLISLIVDEIKQHQDLPIAFECLRYLMSSDIDNSIFFVPFRSGRYPPIGALFNSCVLTASEDVWKEYIKIFYLLLSKGLNVNTDGDQKHLLFIFIKIYENWSPRLHIILDILIDQGLDLQSFFDEVYNRDDYSYKYLTVEFIFYVSIPHFMQSSYKNYCNFFECLSECGTENFKTEFYEMYKFDTLKSFCRSAIRRQLKKTCKTSNDSLRAVKSLKIPESLKNYIRFKIY